jgi:hypothetical protein
MLPVIAAVSGCQGLEELAQGDDDGIPAPVQAAFDESCNGGGCHDASSRAGGLSLASADSPGILESSSNGHPMVEIGDVEGSYLAMKILGSPGIAGSQMPARAPIPEDEANLSVIIAWVAGIPIGEGDDTPAQACVAPETIPNTIDYDLHIAPIFEAHCAGSSCHEDSEATGFQIIDVDPTEALIGVVAVDHEDQEVVFVQPGEPSESYLWHRLLGTGDLVGGGSRRMPAGADALCADEMEIIYRWIVALPPAP